MMPQHLLCFPYPITYNLHHSVLHPPSLVHLPSSITLSLCHPCSCPPSSSLLSVSMYPNSLPLRSILSLSSRHPFITPCLPIPTLSTLHSIPCDSLSHFLHSPYYPIHHPTPSLVVYKSFQLVVYSLACNCHPLLPTQYPPSLPQSPINLSPDNTIPLCLPCLSPLKLRTPLFLGKGATHKLKPSPYPYAAISHNLSTTLRALHSTPSTFPMHLLDSGVALTSSLPHSIHYSIPHSFPHLLSTPHSIHIIVSTPLESNL